MVRVKSFAFLCAILAIPLIGRADPQNVVESSADESQLHAFFHEPFEKPLGYSLVLGDASERILTRFGQPMSRKSTRYAARTSNELRWNTVFSYDGMTISIGESEDRSRSWLESIEITNDECPLRFGVEVGAFPDDITKAFRGSRYVEVDEELRYFAEIWESRTDSKYLPGQEVTVRSAMQLSLSLDDAGRVSRILIERNEL
jgi:hypothetical protein